LSATQKRNKKSHHVWKSRANPSRRPLSAS